MTWKNMHFQLYKYILNLNSIHYMLFQFWYSLNAKCLLVGLMKFLAQGIANIKISRNQRLETDEYESHVQILNYLYTICPLFVLISWKVMLVGKELVYLF